MYVEIARIAYIQVTAFHLSFTFVYSISCRNMNIIGVLYYRNQRRALRRERVFRDRINPLDKYDDTDFRLRYRFSREVVLTIIDDVQEDLQGRLFKASDIPPSLQVLLAMRFFATGSFQRTAGDLHGGSISTTHRIIHKVAAAIAMRKNRYIRFPRVADYNQVKRDIHSIAAFPNVIGAIDCTHIKITKPHHHNPMRFINRKGVYSINVQIVCNAKLEITNIVARWPGGTHDSRILENCRLIRVLEHLQGSFLLGDAGYACSHYIMTPLRNPTTNQERRYNSAHARTRSVVERLFGIWKRRFHVLQDPMRTRLDNTLVIIVAAAVLHNIAQRHEMEPPEEEDHDDGDSESDEEGDAIPVAGNARGNAVRRHLIDHLFW